jgi:ribosomal protection tetracycline resistance protein
LTKSLNLGILAHVDAGKTSLTERLLYAAGVIDTIGRVDDGTTQTDTLALERRRGITIKAAVVSFTIDDVTVNLIDTPGHPDFIAEVERVLHVLDGAVLVLSAVEGVQAQTRILLRALRRLRIPTLFFVNKIDRRGAQPERVLCDIAAKLTPAIVPMGAVLNPGSRDAACTPYRAADSSFITRLADVVAERDGALLAAYVDDQAALTYARLRHALAAQTKQALVYPVFCGSAITGAGVDSLTAGIAELLPATEPDGDAPLSATVFKIERGPSGDRIAYARLFSGTLRTRDRVTVHRALQLPAASDPQPDAGRKVTSVAVFERGSAVPRTSIVAGQIGKLWGLGDVQIGDALGVPRMAAAPPQFAPPTLEAIVVPRRPTDRSALYLALTQLAEQDPLINLRQDDVRHELSVSLYGEVQKEVVQATLADEYGLEVAFRDTTTICVERPSGTAEAVELLGSPANPFCATVGLRVEPAPPGSGVRFRLEAELATLPLYVYKSIDEFRNAMESTVQETLRQGLYGWQVADCTVVMTRSGYVSPSSTAADFRKLTPLVLMCALQRAGTVVCEPILHFRLELPADTLGAALPALARLSAVPHAQEAHGPTCALEGDVPAARVHALQQQLPALTRGEGVLECVFDRYQPVRGAIPTRPRTDHNPLNRKQYLLHVLRRV